MESLLLITSRIIQVTLARLQSLQRAYPFTTVPRSKSSLTLDNITFLRFEISKRIADRNVSRSLIANPVPIRFDDNRIVGNINSITDNRQRYRRIALDFVHLTSYHLVDGIAGRSPLSIFTDHIVHLILDASEKFISTAIIRIHIEAAPLPSLLEIQDLLYLFLGIPNVR